MFTAPVASRHAPPARRPQRLMASAWAGLVLLLSSLLLVEAAAARPMVEEVSLTARSDGRGYVLRVQATEKIDAYSMPRRVGEHEVEWVLYNTGVHSRYRAVKPKGPVTRTTTTRHNGHVILRFELDPNRPVDATAYRDGASNDLLLNFGYRGGAVADRGEQPVRTAGQAAVAGAPGESGASQQARERWRLDTVVIDAGHGGKDPGATANGLREKDIVLKVAKKLGGYLEEKLGLNVVFTRTGDTFVELEERGHIANRANAKLFISLHVNAAGARSARGTETFFLGRHKTEAARKVMERENSVIRFEDNPEEYDDYNEQALVRQTLAQSAYMRQSQRLAGLIEHQFEHRVSRKSRGVHQAGFYVLWSASMPAVLVEMGFLTNPGEARFLASDLGQTYLASALFRAVRDYKQQYEKGIETVSTE